MTELLSKAFSAAMQLPEAEQDSLAAWLLAELESDRRWEEASVAHADALHRLAAEAVAEHHAGLTQPLDPERM